MDFIEELSWRGMVQDITPGTQEYLQQQQTSGYIGFDPTASSLHIGNMLPIMLLVHFQRSGHKPIALVGGATGMIGDPSGKTDERQLLSVDRVVYNLECVKQQLSRFLDFTGPCAAQIVNNYDWFKDIRFLDFLRDVGKHLTVNYMVAKEAVKNRWDKGISFTEFSYQLLQAYDYYWLNKNQNCSLQMGGSDQWGNITAGTELIRRKAGGDAFALTCPLLTKADGTKFGKTAGGESVWLDATRTSPYRFYQYWLNTADADAPRLLRLFTLMPKEAITAIEEEHAASPHLRALQKALARDMTIRVHSEDDYRFAVEASDILFGKGTAASLQRLSEDDFLAVFDGVPQMTIARTIVESGCQMVDLICEQSGMFPSKGEARRLIAQGGLFLNKEKVADAAMVVTTGHLISGRYLLLQKGKKSYFIIKVV